MRCFVISLRDSSERRNSVYQSFSDYGINFEFIDAFRGADLDRKHDSRIFNRDSFELRNNCLSKVTVKGQLTDGELGCALSHLTAYQKIVTECPQGAIVCEDDFRPACNFIKLIEQILKERSVVDLIHPCTDPRKGLRQGWFNTQYKTEVDGSVYTYFRAGIPGFDWMFNRRRRIDSALCLYLSNNAASRLLSLGYPVRMEADRLTGMVAYNKLKAFISVPKIGTTLAKGSIIGSGRHQKAY